MNMGKIPDLRVNKLDEVTRNTPFDMNLCSETADSIWSANNFGSTIFTIYKYFLTDTMLSTTKA